MGKHTLRKVKGYPGVYYREGIQHTGTRGRPKKDVSYYVNYQKDGKRISKFVGLQSKGMAPSTAALILIELKAGRPVQLPEPRKSAAQKIKDAVADMGGLQADDYSGPKQDRPPEWWTFNRIYEFYVEHRGGECPEYGNFKTDRGNFNNHLKRPIGDLRPEDMTRIKVEQLRKVLRKKKGISYGRLRGLATAKRRRDDILKRIKGTRKKADQIRLARQIDKAEAKVKDIRKKIRESARFLAPSTVEKIIELCRRLSNFAAENDLCPGAPHRIKLRKIDNEKTEDLTPEQIRDVLVACDQDPNQDVADIVRLALMTGLRLGSILPLSWKDVNFQKKFVLILHTKSKKQIKVPMSKEAEKILRTRSAVADRTVNDYVFPGKNEGTHRKGYHKQARRIMRVAGLPDDFRPTYGQRHAFASNLANTGEVDLYQLSKLLGHASTEMTKRYAHLRDDALRRASNQMSDIISNAMKAPQDDQDGAKKAG